jgi:hypothetical protein
MREYHHLLHQNQAFALLFVTHRFFTCIIPTTTRSGQKRSTHALSCPLPEVFFSLGLLSFSKRKTE